MQLFYYLGKKYQIVLTFTTKAKYIALDYGAKKYI